MNTTAITTIILLFSTSSSSYVWLSALNTYNSHHYYLFRVKTHNYINRQNQSGSLINVFLDATNDPAYLFVQIMWDLQKLYQYRNSTVDNDMGWCEELKSNFRSSNLIRTLDKRIVNSCVLYFNRINMLGRLLRPRIHWSTNLTDFVCLYNYEFWLSLFKIVRSSGILLLPSFHMTVTWKFDKVIF
jgi:hypothetical protein